MTVIEMKLTKPGQLKAGHSLRQFDCGNDALTDWLKRHALKAASDRTAYTYVVCRGNKRVVGYYSIATAAVFHDSTNSKVRRNMPNPIPAMKLLRLGVDTSEQGQGLGKSLVRDAFLRISNAVTQVAARLVIIDAIDDEVVQFYKKLDFKPLKKDSLTLYLTVDALMTNLAEVHKRKAGTKV